MESIDNNIEARVHKARAEAQPAMAAKYRLYTLTGLQEHLAEGLTGQDALKVHREMVEYLSGKEGGDDTTEEPRKKKAARPEPKHPPREAPSTEDQVRAADLIEKERRRLHLVKTGGGKPWAEVQGNELPGMQRDGRYAGKFLDNKPELAEMNKPLKDCDVDDLAEKILADEPVDDTD